MHWIQRSFTDTASCSQRRRSSNSFGQLAIARDHILFSLVAKSAAVLKNDHGQNQCWTRLRYGSKNHAVVHLLPGTQPSTLTRSVGEEEEREGATASRGFRVLAASVSREKSSQFGCVCASLCRTLLDMWLDIFLNRSNLKCRFTSFCPDLWLGPMKGQGIRCLRERVGGCN